MAVTLTVQEVAVGVRISVDPTAAVPEPYLNILTRHLAVATAIVEGRAPDADDQTQNQAAIRICGWLYDQPPNGNRFGNSSAWYRGIGAPGPQMGRVMESV